MMRNRVIRMRNMMKEGQGRGGGIEKIDDTESSSNHSPDRDEAMNSAIGSTPAEHNTEGPVSSQEL